LHYSAGLLLDLIEQSEEITVTRHGREVAVAQQSGRAHQVKIPAGVLPDRKI
jgi:antitoxin (DNA-binding transcriptional repressor) of toxin-antitoxin stability system